MYFKGISAEILKDYIDAGESTVEKWSKEEKKEKYEEALLKMMTMFQMLSEGSYIEQTKLFTGDPAMYKNTDDFFKRMSMVNSTKKGSIIDKRTDDILNTRNGVLIYKTVDGNRDRTIMTLERCLRLFKKTTLPVIKQKTGSVNYYRTLMFLFLIYKLFQI